MAGGLWLMVDGWWLQRMLRAPGVQGFGFLARDLPGFRLSGGQVQVISLFIRCRWVATRVC